MAKQPVYVLTQEAYNEYVAAVRKLRNVSGPGVNNAPDALTINAPPAGRRVEEGRRVNHGFWARITSSSSISDNRWSYGFAASRYLSEGTFEDIPGESGGFTGIAYNSVEVNNDDSGVQGNGVSVANLAEGIEIVPVGVGAIVWMRGMVNCDTGAFEYLFEGVNQIDGECAGGEE